MANHCSNTLTMTGPVTDETFLLALSIGTDFAYNPLAIDEEEFDPETSGLPEELAEPNHAFIGECEFLVTSGSTLTGWADSRYEPPLEWLRAMSKRFPLIRFEIIYFEPAMEISGKTTAFEGHLKDYDMPAR